MSSPNLFPKSYIFNLSSLEAGRFAFVEHTCSIAVMTSRNSVELMVSDTFVISSSRIVISLITGSGMLGPLGSVTDVIGLGFAIVVVLVGAIPLIFSLVIRITVVWSLIFLRSLLSLLPNYLSRRPCSVLFFLPVCF